MLLQVNVSLGRLRKFLGNDELDPDTVTKDDNASMYQKVIYFGVRVSSIKNNL